MPNLLRKLHGALLAERSAAQTAAAVLTGTGLGLASSWTPQWFMWLLALAWLRVQLLVAIGTAIVFHFVSLLAEPWIDSLGTAFLGSSLFRPILAQMYHLPFFPLSRFYNSVVAGRFLLTLWLAPTLFFVVLTQLRRREWPPAKRWVQWEAILPGCVVVAIAVLTLPYWGNNMLREYIERKASFVHGAKVEIGELHARYLHPRLVLNNVVIRNPTNPTFGWLRLDKLTVHLSRRALWSRKILITDLGIEGVSFDSTSYDDPATLGYPPTDLQLHFKTDWNDSPFRSLAQLFSGLPLRRMVGTFRNRLETTARLQALEKEWNAKESEWRASIEALVTRATENDAELVRDMRQMRKSLDLGEREFAAKLKTAMSGIRRDVLRLRRQLNLPSLRHNDLSSSIFGPHLMALAEPLSTWLGSARNILQGSRTRDILEPTERGTNFHYAIDGALPRFLLPRAQFSTESATGDRVTGAVEALTSHPTMYGVPFRLVMKADFPTSGIRELTAEALIDHTRPDPVESLRLSFARVPVKDWNISSVHTLGIRLSGHAAIDIEAQIRGNELVSQGRAVFSDLHYKIDNGQRDTVQALDAALDSLTGFTLAGEVRGPLSALEINLTSELGQRLAKELRELIKTPLAAVDDTLRHELLDELDPNARALEGRVSALKQWALQRLESVGKPLKNPPLNTEKEKG